MVLDEGFGFEGVIGKGMTSNFVASDMPSYFVASDMTGDMAGELIVDDDVGYVACCVVCFMDCFMEKMAVGLGKVGIEGGSCVEPPSGVGVPNFVKSSHIIIGLIILLSECLSSNR